MGGIWVKMIENHSLIGNWELSLIKKKNKAEIN